MPYPAAKHNLFWLVVHGSFGPGGSNHDRLVELPGAWHPGSFSAAAGAQFSDLVVMRYHDEDVLGWALQVALKPKNPGDTSDGDGNTTAQLFETWAAIDQLFGDDVVRMDTTFQFKTSQPGEGDVCRANTYGSPDMVPDGRYDAPHPASELVDLWHEVVAGNKNYDPLSFGALITTLEPERYATAFEVLPDHGDFLERLELLAADPVIPDPVIPDPVAVEERMPVEESVLLELARSAVQTKSQAISLAVGDDWQQNQQLLAGLRYQIAQPEASIELGDLHYDLSEGFADAARFSMSGPWSGGLSAACYSIADSYDLAYWLTQGWRETSVDLEPLYALWKAGGSVVVDTAGVAHVSTAASR